MQDMPPDMAGQQKEEVQIAAVMPARDTRVTTSTKGPGAPAEDVHASAHHGAHTEDDASPPPSNAPQTASFEGALHAFEAQGASRSIGGAAPVVMPHLGEDSIVLQEAHIANFYSEFQAELDA